MAEFLPTGPQVGSVELLADLRLELTSDRGNARVHLHGGADGLVLDVDEPGLVLGEVRGRGWPGSAVTELVQGLAPATPIRVRSQGRELGRLSLTSGGRVSLRPTVAGVSVAARIVLADRRVQVALLASAFALVVAVVRSLTSGSQR